MNGIKSGIFNRLAANPYGALLLLFFVVSVFLLSFTKVHDSDTWMHLSLGRLIWDLKGLPENEVFTYPAYGTPFLYTSWLFAVICYLVEFISGGVGLTFLKALAVTSAFYIMFKDSLRPHGNYFVAVLALSASVLAAQPRFTLRPDIFMMVFLSFSIMSLNAYLYERKKYIYGLPLIHLLWANTHSSIPLMLVPFGAFIGGGLIHKYVLGKWIVREESVPDLSQIKTLAVVFAVSFLATLINPNFTGQYSYGSDLLQSRWIRSFVVELFPPAGTDRKIIYLADAMVLLSFALNFRRFSLVDLLLVAPFLYFPFESLRFTLALSVVAAPVAARNISGFIKDVGLNAEKRISLAAAPAIIWIVIYTSLAFADVRPFGHESSRFGAGFDYSEVPEGAVKYMDSRKIRCRVLNTFDYGGYIIWQGYPGREVFIDSRGHLPEELLWASEEFRTARDILDNLYGRFGFEAVLVKYPYTTLFEAKAGAHAAGGGEVVYYPILHPDWALVYWDDNSLLLLRRNGTYGDVVLADEYRFITPDKDPADIFRVLYSAESRERVLEELIRNASGTDSSFGYTMLGIIYNNCGQNKEAIESFKKVKKGVKIGTLDLEYIAHTLSGDSYLKLGDNRKSLDSFKKALKLNKDAHYSVALYYKKTGDRQGSLKHFREYLEYRPEGPYAERARQEIRILTGAK